MAFCTVGSRPWPSSTGGRSSLYHGHTFHGDVSLHSMTEMGVAGQQAWRTEESLSMKVKTHKGRKSPKARRGGPRTDAEGYSAEAFGEWIYSAGWPACVTSRTCLARSIFWLFQSTSYVGLLRRWSKHQAFESVYIIEHAKVSFGGTKIDFDF